MSSELTLIPTRADDNSGLASISEIRDCNSARLFVGPAFNEGVGDAFGEADGEGLGCGLTVEVCLGRSCCASIVTGVHER